MRRLERLDEVTPEQLAAQIEEARKEGYKLVRLPGLRVWILDYSLKAPEDGNEE